MNAPYAEAAYFDGHHVQHIADYQEHQRLERAREQARRAALSLQRRRLANRAEIRLDQPPRGGRAGFPPVAPSSLSLQEKAL